jgi:hypothetical protein
MDRHAEDRNQQQDPDRFGVKSNVCDSDASKHHTYKQKVIQQTEKTKADGGDFCAQRQAKKRARKQ